jgi:hypothetical protein
LRRLQRRADAHRHLSDNVMGHDALTHSKSRAAFARLVDQGWTDALRKMHPNDRIYTFWHYMRQRWERDAGLRLDHLLLSPPLAIRLEDAGVERTIRGLENASDHAPLWLKLRRSTQQRARKRKATDTSAASKTSPELAQTISPAADAKRMTTRSRSGGLPKLMTTNRPLLVIDGDKGVLRPDAHDDAARFHRLLQVL